MVAPFASFGNHVDLTAGGGGGLSHYFGSRRRVGVFFEFAATTYEQASVRRPLSPTIPTEVEVSGRSELVEVLLGSQLLLREGVWSPYVRAAAGLLTLETRTVVDGGDDAPLASGSNLKDRKWVVSPGGGVRVAVANIDEITIVVDLGVSYVRTGFAEYAREGGLEIDPAGVVTFERMRSAVSYGKAHLGLVLARR